jgi:hypothetical protein
MSNIPSIYAPRIADGEGAYTNDGAGALSWKAVTPKAGFPSRLDSVLSRVDGTRTLSVTPSGTDFHFYVDGTKHTKAAAQTVVWGDVEGIWLFYFDSTGTLVATNDLTLWSICILNGCALTAALYWDATNNVSIRFLDERHNSDRNRYWHLWAHTNLGCQWTSGSAITPTLVDSIGSSTDSAKITIAEGYCADEDIIVAAASTGTIPIFYLEGSGSASTSIVVSSASISAFNGTYTLGGTETVGGFVRNYYSLDATHHISVDSTGFNYWCLYSGARTNPVYTAATYVRLQSAGVVGLYQDLFLTISALASNASANSTPPFRRKTADAYPFIQDGATISGGTWAPANDLPAYNNINAGGAGVWGLTEVANGAYFAVHYFQTTDLEQQFVGLLGQTTWMDINKAREGAVREMGTLKLIAANLANEAVEIGTVMFRGIVDAASIEGYDNATHVSVISIDPVQSITYMDWRRNGTTRGLNSEEYLRQYDNLRRSGFFGATDFTSSTTSTAALYAGSPWWSGTSLNSGTIAVQTGTAAHPGILRLRSTASANTGYNYLTNIYAFTLAGLESSEFVFQTETATSSCSAWLGWTAAATNGATTRCAVLAIDVSGGAWRLLGRVHNGADRTAATTYTLANTTWYSGRVSFNSALTETEFEVWSEGKAALLFRSRIAFVPDTVIGHGVIGINASASQQYCIAIDYMNISAPKTLAR